MRKLGGNYCMNNNKNEPCEHSGCPDLLCTNNILYDERKKIHESGDNPEPKKACQEES